MLVLDYESKLYLDAAAKLLPLWSPDDVKYAERHLRARSEMVDAGVRRCPTWFQEELITIDPYLRCWWDAWKEEWVIDRFQSEGVIEGLLRLAEQEPEEYRQSLRKSASGILEKGPYYLTVVHFKQEGEFRLDRHLLDMLRASDLQKFKNPAEYIRQKEAAAEAVLKANDKASDDKMLAAVDSLSNKQIHEFIEVSKVLGTDETLIAHGESAKIMEGIAEARRKGPPMPISKPDIFRPKRKGYK